MILINLLKQPFGERCINSSVLTTDSVLSADNDNSGLPSFRRLYINITLNIKEKGIFIFRKCTLELKILLRHHTVSFKLLCRKKYGLM
jgi:hypothetical protein